MKPSVPLRSSTGPESLKDHLSHDQLRLYELIWKRAVASQMTPAQFDTVAADIAVGERQLPRHRSNPGLPRLPCRLPGG